MKGKDASELGSSRGQRYRQALANRLVVRDTTTGRDDAAAFGLGRGGEEDRGNSHHLSRALLVLVSTSDARKKNASDGRRGIASYVACRKENSNSTLLGFSQTLDKKTRELKEALGSHVVAFAPKESAKAGQQLQVLQLRGGASDAKDEKLKKEAKDFKRECYKALRNLLAGAIAGGSVEAALYPIDTIKTRLQATKGAINFSGKIKALKGSSSLYSGVLGNLLGVIPASALFFSVYEPVKEKLQEPSVGVPQWCAQFGAAAAAAVSASFIRVPTEVIKSRMQMGQFKSALVALQTVVAQEGVTGIYAGYKSFLLRDIIFDVVEFVSYEQIRDFYLKKQGRERVTAYEGSAIGACAGALTASITTPFDVIKTRMMLQGTNKVYAGGIDCMMKMIAEEGMGSLFKGVGPRVTWISVGGAVFFGALEKTKELLAKLEPKDD
jgi:solute carrier family 25 S-adenosylmethionine transporter 26